jgi:hypothetical protein
MKIAIKFLFVVTLALIGCVFHGFKPKKRELSDEHYI